ncbi:MAG: hypothetical protein WBZ36_29950 [Candidatus Nitrosopolaris sp.]
MMKNNVKSDMSRVCDGYGCYSSAESEINVKVGPKRSISLSLCERCKTKFDGGHNSEVVSVTDRDIFNETKMMQSLRSAQVRGHGQIAVVENNTSRG